MKLVKAWGGFCDGVLNRWESGVLLQPGIAVFATREQARQHYVDVRRIEIREVPRKARKAVARGD